MSTRQIDINLFNYARRATVEVNVGGVTIGCTHPVRVQSMTNTSTMDTEGSVEQVLRIVAKGGDIVRLTTQGNREAVNLGDIKGQLKARGCNVPLVADVHFNAAVADTAAKMPTKSVSTRAIMSMQPVHSSTLNIPMLSMPKNSSACVSVLFHSSIYARPKAVLCVWV